MSYSCPCCKTDFGYNQEELTQHFKDNVRTCGRYATELLKNKMMRVRFDKDISTEEIDITQGDVSK